MNILGKQPLVTSESSAVAAANLIMKTLQKKMDAGTYLTSYLGFISASDDLLGLCVQGLLLEVVDRPNAETIYIGGAVLMGEKSDIDDSYIWCAENANDLIKESQQIDSKSIFFKCHSDEVVGLHLALRYLSSQNPPESSAAYQSQYQRLLRTTSIPIVISNKISESLGIDVLMKKYKHTGRICSLSFSLSLSVYCHTYIHTYLTHTYTIISITRMMFLFFLSSTHVYTIQHK